MSLVYLLFAATALCLVVWWRAYIPIDREQAAKDAREHADRRQRYARLQRAADAARAQRDAEEVERQRSQARSFIGEGRGQDGGPLQPANF